MKPRKTLPQHNYLRKLRYLMRTGTMPRTVGLHQVQVDHDAWCGHWQLRRCNGDPHVTLKFSLPAAAQN